MCFIRLPILMCATSLGSKSVDLLQCRLKHLTDSTAFPGSYALVVLECRSAEFLTGQEPRPPVNMFFIYEATARTLVTAKPRFKLTNHLLSTSVFSLICETTL